METGITKKIKQHIFIVLNIISRIIINFKKENHHLLQLKT